MMKGSVSSASMRSPDYSQACHLCCRTERYASSFGGSQPPLAPVRSGSSWQTMCLPGVQQPCIQLWTGAWSLCPMWRVHSKSRVFSRAPRMLGALEIAISMSGLLSFSSVFPPACRRSAFQR